MNVSLLASAASSNGAATVQGQASLLVFKKAMEMQQANAVQLLQAPPQPTPVPGATVGRTIDAFV